MSDVDLQKRIFQTIETEGPLSLSQIAREVEVKESVAENAISDLVDRDLVVVSSYGCESKFRCEAPVPISELAFRGELTPTQAVIRYLYEKQGYGQSQIARILNYSPGNIQTNLDRIEEKLDRELTQSDEDQI